MRELRNAAKIVGMALVTAAIVQELRKQPGERTWRGRLNFSIPYDFTIPTPERLKEAYWNPDDDRIFTDRTFGVGWAVNFHALFRRMGCPCCLPSPKEED